MICLYAHNMSLTLALELSTNLTRYESHKIGYSRHGWNDST